MTRLAPRLTAVSEQCVPLLYSLGLLKRKNSYRSRLRKARFATPDAGITHYVTALKRDGVVVIPDFLDHDMITTMLAAVPDRAEFKESPDGERSYSFWEADRIPELAPFFASDVIRDVARSHISRSATCLRSTIGLKIQPGNLPSFESFFHVDCWKHRVKAFLYLEDVGDDDGPLSYISGSHRGLWRLPVESRLSRFLTVNASGFSTTPSRYLGCFWPHEIDLLKKSYGYAEITCTGKAGTLILFDARGLHRGEELRSQRRLILTSYWIHPGDHT